MARFIDLDAVEFLKVDGNEEFNHGVDCCINKLLEIEPADVVERAEYQKLKEKNTELEIMSDNFLRLNEVLKKENSRLHEKINKAIEEIANLPTWGGHLDVSPTTVLGILKRNIEDNSHA